MEASSALMVLLALMTAPNAVSGINCYVCSSKNGSDSACHDPFHPARSSYKSECKVPKDGHEGEFPAKFCLKIIGTSVTTGEELVIRACIMESMDNQCGEFRFMDDRYHSGCILTCNSNGCNDAPSAIFAACGRTSVAVVAMLTATWRYVSHPSVRILW